MRFQVVLALSPILLWSGAARAQDGTTAIACDTLLAARRVDAATGSGQPPATDAGCRRVERDKIRSVEQRALIGGAPYECMTIAGAGRCLWIVP
ncbi:hypothetical protein SAMN05216360_102112 [Methylobacterium phyllostachyos]|uniref:Secreted protein n=1 Tax=Methylobacterium phyllostachyos TaxID=582672 RepID=A0A1G9T9N3_9HYPH|nr:hypothetical protein [Methylobacterium phyllostachyos]SDM44397.1 hypothetical protein SAMN05216360_102112 [Methylobacterium phyllostachyos]